MNAKTASDTTSLAVIGVDIGKEVFHLVGMGADGKIAFRRKIRRLALKDAFEQLPPCIVGMEARLSEHYVSRTLRALGHAPRIIPAIYTKPFVKGQNDYTMPRRSLTRRAPICLSAGNRHCCRTRRITSSSARCHRNCRIPSILLGQPARLPKPPTSGRPRASPKSSPRRRASASSRARGSRRPERTN
jgi:hypothetical protein